MSTEIRCGSSFCRDDTDGISLNAREGFAGPDEVYVKMWSEGKEALGHYVNRADFLAAVETELGVRIVPADAIVIDRSEVHPVETSKYKDVHTCDGYAYGYNREKTARRQALSLLAYDEYMDAHLRVDEAQVEALEAALVVAQTHPGSIARMLVADGWTKP